MKEHEFTLILSSSPDDDGADRLYEVIHDGTISHRADVASIAFHRESPHLEDAIRSAIVDVQACGFQVKRVELEPTTIACAG
jgi:hypothetical protein